MSVINIGTGEKSPEPFQTHAIKYSEMGISVFPCGGDDGKAPLVKWSHLQNKLASEHTINKWSDKYPNANIGIVTGEISNLTIIDCDNLNLSINELFNEFGKTPLIAQTPRGGYHLYYTYNGEKNSQDIDRKIDIRGQGGFVVVPPSYNHTHDKKYEFIEGDLWDIKDLPLMQKTVVKNNDSNKKSIGERNTALFSYLKLEAKDCKTNNELITLAINYNDNNLEPLLSKDEVLKTSNSIWEYKLNNRLYNKSEQYIILNIDKINQIIFKYPRAYSLYSDLVRCHNKTNEFAISPRGYKKRCGWNHTTISKSINTLIEKGLIKQIYQGGKFKGDCSLYMFC